MPPPRRRMTVPSNTWMRSRVPSTTLADTRTVYDWLAARPDVSDTKIGAWGISYGGGAVFNSLVAGVPWAAVTTVQTWTDLYAALMPQGLVKSGLVAGLSAKPVRPAVIRRRRREGVHRGQGAVRRRVSVAPRVPWPVASSSPPLTRDRGSARMVLVSSQEKRS